MSNSKLEKWKADLKLAEDNVGKDAIKNNPVLLKSLNGKIHALRALINTAEKKGGATKTPQTSSAPKKSTQAKQEKKSKKEKPEIATTTKFKPDDKIVFVKRGEEKETKATIVRIYASYHSGKLIAVVKTKDGKKSEVYVTKLSYDK